MILTTGQHPRRVVLPGIIVLIAHLSGHAPPLLAAGQQPTFQSSVRLIQVSVVVHDKNGQPVSDLTAADFKLYENGKEQPIAVFSSAELAASDATVPDFAKTGDAKDDADTTAWLEKATQAVSNQYLMINEPLSAPLTQTRAVNRATRATNNANMSSCVTCRSGRRGR